MPRLWIQEEDDRLAGEEPQGKGLVTTMDVALREKINKFCILNSHAMEKWIERYNLVKPERDQACLSFRRSRTTPTLPYPIEFTLLPDFPSSKWL